MNNNTLKQFSLEEIEREYFDRKYGKDKAVIKHKDGSVYGIEVCSHSTFNLCLCTSVDQFDEGDADEAIELEIKHIDTIIEVLNQFRSKQNDRNK